MHDPVQRVFDAWRYLAHFKQFEAEGSIERLAEKAMAFDPTFPEFIAQYSRYLKYSPTLKAALQLTSAFIGKKLNRMDLVYGTEYLNLFRQDLSKRSKIRADQLVDWSPREPRPILDEYTVERLEKLTRDDYGFLVRQYQFQTSPLLERAYRPDLVNLGALPALTAPAADPSADIHLVTLMGETPEITRAFVEHYRKIGIGKMFLYFDDPNDPMAAELASDPFVVATPCNDSFWPDAKRPGSIEARQSICYTRTYRTLETGWLICCDADELIYAGEGLKSVLDRTGNDQWVVRAQSCEAIWAEGTDIHEVFGAAYIRKYLKPPHWPRIRNQIYGTASDLLEYNMVGHRYGKYIIRCGLKPERLSIHQAIFSSDLSDHTLGKTRATCTEVSLVHHDARSFEDWCAKLEKRTRPRHGFFAQGKYRARQIKAYRKARDEGQLEQLFRQLYVLDADKLKLLATCNVAGRIGSDPKVSP